MTSSSPRIAFLTPAWPPKPGGLANAAHRLVQGLRRHRPIAVFAPDPAMAPGQRTVETSEDLTLTRFGASDHADLQRRFFELVTTGGPFGLVHAVYPSQTGFAGCTAARYLNIPCLLAARGNDLDRDAFLPARQPGLLHALAHAQVTVGVSRDLCRLAAALGARETLWIPNGVDAERFRPLPGASREPLILFAGEARAKKGLATMLEAFALLRETHPTLRLRLLGGSREPIPPDVELLPMTDQLTEHWAEATLGWHPSLQDGLPNAVLEAMACAKVTIGSTAGGLPDLLPPELLVPPGDAAALAERTRRLLADPALPAMGQRLRERVLAAFTPEAEVAAYLRLYERLNAL